MRAFDFYRKRINSKNFQRQVSMGLRVLVCLGAVLSLLSLTAFPVAANGVIQSVTAMIIDGQVVLTWVVGDETNMTGYYIRRTTLETGQNLEDAVWSTLGGRIQKTGGPTYEYVDATFPGGSSTYYMVGVEDGTTGNITWSEPALAQPPATTTHTLTPTNTLDGASTAVPTVTPIPTATSDGGYPAPVIPPTPTTGAYPAPPPATTTPTTAAPSTPGTPTVTVPASVTPSITATGVLTNTPTLIPVPELNLLFLPPTPSRTPTRTPIPTATLEGRTSLLPADWNVTPQVATLGGVIVVVWVLLGVFLAVYLKQVGY